MELVSPVWEVRRKQKLSKDQLADVAEENSDGEAPVKTKRKGGMVLNPEDFANMAALLEEPDSEDGEDGEEEEEGEDDLAA